MEIKSNQVFYAELPSRNVYVDSVVNDLPGYYPARSEFTVEYNNDIEQDLTDVCVLYDAIVKAGEEDSSDEEEEEDPLKKLLSHVKKEPDSDCEDVGELGDISESSGHVEQSSDNVEQSSENIKDSTENSENFSETVNKVGTSFKGRKRKTLNSLESGSSEWRKKMRQSSPVDEMHCRVDVKQEESSDENSVNAVAMEGESFEPKSASNKETGAKHQLNDEDRAALEELCLAAIDIYNNRLRERNERKQFVRNHGFLDQKKIYSWYNIHNLELGDGLFGILLKKFIKLFDTAYEFDKFVQQLKLEKELRIKLSYLDELRSNGIRHKRMIPLYNQLKENKNKVQTDIRNVDIRDIVTLSSYETPDATGLKPKRSRKLEISHLPMYKSLTPDERELCSSIRLTPESYLNFKQIIIAECKKLGGLKLAQARPLLKIDVNKTRRVFDYLIAQKLIWK